MGGWGSDGNIIVSDLRKPQYSFVLVQESKHRGEGDPRIEDPSSRFVAYHTSTFDPNDSDSVPKGGIITYVNCLVKAETTVVSKCDDYIATKTGNLIIINCYLPCENGTASNRKRYAKAIDEIISIIKFHQDDHCFVLAGDFNNTVNGSNMKHFNRLIEVADLTDRTSNIPFTYHANLKNGKICHSKLDHYLTKNFPEGSFVASRINKSLGKNGHSVLEMDTFCPHIELEKVEDADCEDPFGNRIFPDFDRSSGTDHDFLRSEMTKIIDDCQRQFERGLNKNPLNLVTKAFEKIGKVAEWRLPQKICKHNNKNISGFSEIVKSKRFDFQLAVDTYLKNGGNMRTRHDDPNYQIVIDKKRIMDEAVKEARSRKREFDAKSLVDDYTRGGSKRCWKPVRAAMKGGNLKPSSIVEGLKDKQRIADFWQKHYMEKMKGQLTPQREHSEAFKKLADKAKAAPKLIFTKEQALTALGFMKNDKAYYDQYTPRLLKIVKEEFCGFFADMIAAFVNATAEEQVDFCQEENFLVSYITPIKKSASLNPTAKKTYRPISVSHTLSVLFERLIKVACIKVRPPKIFYGYIPNRSTATAVRTLKNIVGVQQTKDGLYLIMLDASGAFEAVLWDEVFPKMAESIHPRAIQAIWMTYRFNRYEIRWNGKKSTNYFYARQGTKQGVSFPEKCL